MYSTPFKRFLFEHSNNDINCFKHYFLQSEDFANMLTSSNWTSSSIWSNTLKPMQIILQISKYFISNLLHIILLFPVVDLQNAVNVTSTLTPHTVRVHANCCTARHHSTFLPAGSPTRLKTHQHRPLYNHRTCQRRLWVSDSNATLGPQLYLTPPRNI